MTLLDYRTELRDEIDDTSPNTNQSFTDATLNRKINQARKYVNMKLLEYQNQQFIIPELYIDEYSLESDYIKVDSLIDITNQLTLPTNKAVKESSNDVLYYWDNGMRVKESGSGGRKIQFKEVPTDIKGALNISSFDRANNMIKVNAGLGLGTLSNTTLETTITVSTNTKPLRAGYQISVDGGSTYPHIIASITDDYTFELETAVDWSGAAQDYLYLKSDDTVPNIPNYANIKPYLQLIGDDSGTPVYEYVRLSFIKGNSDNTEYTFHVTGWDLRHTEVDWTFIAGDSAREVSFVMNYVSIPKTLVSDTDICMLSEEAALMVMYYGAFLCYTKQSRPSLAQQEWVKFEAQREEVIDELNSEKAEAHNNSNPTSINRWIYPW